MASSPPCTAGCSVLTRPSIISGKPVRSLTSSTFRPASLSALRVPPGAGLRHQPHAGARGDGAARARGLCALGAAPRRLRGAQDQARGDRADHRLGGARKHGGAADHRERQRRGDRLAAPHVRDLRERRSARASRRIFRGQHRIPPEHHPHEPQRRADQSRREPVHPHAHDPKEDDRRDRIAPTARSATTCTSSKRWKPATRCAPRALVRDHALGLAEHVAKYADYLD